MIEPSSHSAGSSRRIVKFLIAAVLSCCPTRVFTFRVVWPILSQPSWASSSMEYALMRSRTSGFAGRSSSMDLLNRPVGDCIVVLGDLGLDERDLIAGQPISLI